MRRIVLLALSVLAARGAMAADGTIAAPAPPQPQPYRASSVPPASVAPCPVPITSAGTKAQHLRMAAMELGLAGLGEEAERFRQMADAEVPAGKETANSMVLLKLSVMEVNLTKLRRLGFDFESLNPRTDAGMSLLGLGRDNPPSPEAAKPAIEAPDISPGSIAPPATFAELKADDPFFSVLKSLRDDHLISVLAEPTLVTRSGWQASIRTGGETTVPVSKADGTFGERVQECGMKIQLLPIVLDRDAINVRVEADITALDDVRAATIAGKKVPTITRRSCATSCKVKDGQAVVLGGLKTTHAVDPSAAVGSENAGEKADGKSDKPQETAEETIELVIIKACIVKNEMPAAAIPIPAGK